MQISNAIKHYNATVRKESDPKMTQKMLGEMILPGRSESTIKNYMSHWSNNKLLNMLNASQVRKMCEILHVDAKYLFSDVKVDKEFQLDNLTCDIIQNIYKSTGINLNDLLHVKPKR